MTEYTQPSERIFAHAMLREIFEQPEALRALLRVAVSADQRRLTDALFAPVRALLASASSLVIIASGSSRHAGLAAEVTFEDLSGLPVDVEYASEYSYRTSNTTPGAVVLVISQSGETGDTLAALREARARGQRTIAVTNVPDSTMMREADVALCTEAGKELAIPATKSFTNQLALLHLLAVAAGEARGRLSAEAVAEKLAALAAVADALEGALIGWDERAEACAQAFAGAKSYLFLGRGVHYPLAREGALKLKESSYVHAEGYPAGEVLHGPNALVSDEVPLVALAAFDPKDEDSVRRYERTLNLLGILEKQGARVLALVNQGDVDVRPLVRETIEIPPVPEHLLPLLEVVPLQLFAYYVALTHGVDVDRPRNLVKSVPVA
ncbi:SIS domain-containing protein [Acidipila sp. EB88]|uniref:SIS domain-containing protein n=1 Tax=Acidipila sp. EB88 TaxID=2305226 RepID=UPI000F5F8404|nr:SIS domain-containing protein [Acidipila sp. EB88]RRA47256.1 SIS domain-containing protein [Acidipila sp. EB88]